MNFEQLSESDKIAIGQALRAAADGPFFPDWEFQTLFGLQRSEVRAIADAWPQPTASAENVTIAVNNSLNNLLGYPHSMEAEWAKWISVEPEHLNELFNRLRRGGDERFFHRVM
jgi:hypothetical protein